jgi:hypothetical protein
MSDFVLIAVVALVPVLALVLALACAEPRETPRDEAELNGDACADDRS